MKIIDRINLALRLLIDRGVQTQDGYKNGVHIVQTQTHANGGALQSEHIEQFGYASRAPNGSEHIVLSLGGNRSQTLVVFAHNREYKFELSPGESAMYNQFGDHVHLKDSGEAHVKASTKVFAETPLFECSADCLIGGNLTVEGNTVLKTNTTIEAGVFNCAAISSFTAAASFTAITHNGVSIGTDHKHSGGTISGFTGVVTP